MGTDDNEEARYLVVLEEAAVIDLVAPALEAACVPLATNKAAQRAADALEYEGIEIGGALWGSSSVDAWTGRRVTNVRRATVSKQSKGTAGSFTYSEAALNVKRQLFQALWPQLGFIGTFHTHPYMTTSRTEVASQGLHKPSDDDIRAFKHSSEGKLELIVTLSKKQTANLTPPGWVNFHENRGRLDPACVLFGISDVAVWIRACVWEHDADGRFSMVALGNVQLHCPAVTGLMLPTDEGLMPFRRVGAGKLELGTPSDET